MRTSLTRLFIHFLVGVALAIFLLPEGASIVMAAAVIATAAKTFYDYLVHNVDMWVSLSLFLGSLAVLLATL